MKQKHWQNLDVIWIVYGNDAFKKKKSDLDL